MMARKLVAFRPQPRDDALGIDQRLRAAEGDEGDAWGLVHGLLKVHAVRRGGGKRQSSCARNAKGRPCGFLTLRSCS